MEALLAFVCVSKRLQVTDHGKVAETRLAERLRKGKASGLFTDEHDSQLAGMSVDLVQFQLMEDLRAFGRVPRQVKRQRPHKISGANTCSPTPLSKSRAPFEQCTKRNSLPTTQKTSGPSTKPRLP